MELWTRWLLKPNVAEYGGASWDNEVKFDKP